jgi:hypothetical protein
MKLYPQNLRDRLHALIIKRRSYGMITREARDPSGIMRVLPEPHIGRLGRLWAKRSGLSEKQLATGLPAASQRTLLTAWLVPILPIFLSGVIGLPLVFEEGVPAAAYYIPWLVGSGMLSYLSAVPWAAATFRQLYRPPLRDTEIEALLEYSETDLERAYLTLVRDAIRQEVPRQTEEDVRAAIQALGEAIDRLPTVTLPSIDTAPLRAEAEALIAQARRSGTDRVIAESLERRADALLRRAEAHDRSLLSVQRTDALRSEIEAQIEALRAGLAAFSAGMPVTEDMAHLSESARRVAAEATSAADARAELDALVLHAGVR